jgi:hypothetical protein
MQFVRWLIFLLLLSVIVSFALHIFTGQARFKHYGLRMLKWVVVAGLVFFGVLIVQRIA